MANEEMIQKHLDNFLAKIAGETPVDDTIQNSTEFWINKIAEQGGGGGETKKYYVHSIAATSSAESNLNVSIVVITSDNTQFTIASLGSYLNTNHYNLVTKAYPVFSARVISKTNGFAIADGGIYSPSGTAIYIGLSTATVREGTLTLDSSTRQITTINDWVYEI